MWTNRKPTYKQLKKEKKIKKQQEKLEREKLINSYLKIITNKLDKGYSTISDIVDEVSKEFLDAAIEIEKNKQSLINLVYKNEEEIKEYAEYDEIKNLLNVIEDIRKRMDKIYITVFSDKENNSILKIAEETITNMADMIKEIGYEIKGQKNDYLILSILVAKSKKMLEEYNNYIAESVIEYNPYIDAYIETEESYYNFLLEISRTEEDVQYPINKKEIKKYNDRLRVEYSDLSRFLIAKGYLCIRQNSTTHAIWKNKNLGISVPLPNKSGTVPQGTVSKILKIINSNRNELAEFMTR